jgi:hypothetical protein
MSTSVIGGLGLQRLHQPLARAAQLLGAFGVQHELVGGGGLPPAHLQILHRVEEQADPAHRASLGRRRWITVSIGRARRAASAWRT